MNATRPMQFVLALLMAGCASTDDWSRLERQVRPQAGLQQTQFACIGTIKTPQGRLHVATQRLVLTGMPAPRGQAWLHLFDPDFRLVNSYSLANLGQPLWCEGTKVYFFGFGYHGSIPPDHALQTLFGYPEREEDLGYPTGNVIDFCDGADSPVMRREKRYGSSGGIEDDPMQLDLERGLL